VLFCAKDFLLVRETVAVANPQDLEKLCQGPKVWNAWRAENSERIPDLRGARLTLSQRQFGANHGGPVDLNRTDLEGAELRHATLVGANLQYARLVAVDLVHAQLDHADLAGADLTDAVLDHADLADADLDGAILIGASFANARGMTQEQIANAHGDASTILPAMLMAPVSWYPPLDDDFFIGSPTPDLMQNSDPYEILRVAPTATQEEVRSSFRNLVKLYHPDVNPGDAESQEMFKRISIAYRILGDAERRARYDRGEIDGDGEISPEFEAKQHFRRHAFRIYTAAAASLVLAVGALFAVWYVVLTNEGGDGKVRIAVASPPKAEERLPPSVGPHSFLNREDTAEPEAEQREEAASVDETAAGSGVDKDAEAQPAPENDAVAPASVEKGAEAESATENDAVVPTSVDKSAGAQAAPENDPIVPTSATEAIPGNDPASVTAAPEVPNAAAAETDASAARAEYKPEQGEPAPLGDTKVASLEEGKVEPMAADPAASGAGGAADKAQPSPSSESTAKPEQLPPPTQGTAEPPLGDQHNGGEARPAEADAARSGAPETAPDGAGDEPVAEAGNSGAGTVPRQSPHGDILLRSTGGRKIARDPISAMLRESAISRIRTADKEQATASVGSLLIQDDDDEREEVQDLYRHSVPEASPSPARQWPDTLKAKPRSVARGSQSAGRTPVSVQGQMRRAENAAPPEPGPGAAFRERTVSDVLAGGL
jgi:hypothetical protein